MFGREPGERPDGGDRAFAELMRDDVGLGPSPDCMGSIQVRGRQPAAQPVEFELHAHVVEGPAALAPDAARGRRPVVRIAIEAACA